MEIIKYLTLSKSYLQPRTKKILATIYKNNLEKVIELLENIYSEALPDADSIKQEFNQIIQHNCNFITINDEFYPKLLKQIDTAPIVLTFKGSKSILLKNNIALAGSRKLEESDYMVIRDIVQIINDNDCHVISGLAYGSDIVAHLQSINYGTVAVMPCGLANCYPKEHNIFIDKIIDLEGCILSEYSWHEPPKQQNFINRNRIIVGISDAIYIARARRIKSGSISSANFAKKFNRQIYTTLFDGENEGNKYLLDNNLAIEIKDLEIFRYNLIKNIAENSLYLDNITQELKNKKSCINQLFTNGLEISIEKEVQHIVKQSKIKVIEKNFPQLFELCKNEINTNDIDIANSLLISIFKQ